MTYEYLSEISDHTVLNMDYTLKLILTIFSALITCVLVAGGLKLWFQRKETNDYSRHVLAIFCWFTAINSFTFIFRHWVENIITNKSFLDPEHTFVSIIMQMTFFFYPLAVIRSIIKPGRTYAMLFAPPIVIIAIGMFSGIDYTILNTHSDIWNNIWKPDVILRLFASIVMFVYAFALFLVPYEWNKSSADRKFILKYSLGFCWIGILLFLEFMTHASIFIILHQLSMLIFFFWMIWYELKERLPIPEDMMTDNSAEETYYVIDKLWVDITHILVEHQGWRNPELSLQSLSEELGTNRTYIGEAFKKFAGCTFSEYIAKRRIEYVVSELKRNQHINLQTLFSQAGFRQRSTAYRNFQKIMGVTTTEYLESLK